MESYVRQPSHSSVHSAMEEASIPVYYSPYLGQNPKTFISPIIVPKLLDEETWSSPGYVRTGINKKSIDDITELDDENGNVLEATPYYEQQYSQPRENQRLNQRQVREPYADVKMSKNTPIKDVEPCTMMCPSKERFSNTQSPNKFVGEQLSTPISNTMNTNIADIMGYPYSTHEGVILPLTPNGAYTEKELMKGPRSLYLQSLGPNEYSYSDVTYPISSNLGISYTPTLPPRVLDQVLMSDTYPYNSEPLYHRIDPQLVRTNQPSGRAAELPTRSPWSAQYSNYQPESGTIDYNNIYDGKFTGYGSPYRSYTDVNTGQVKYYYSDIDAYKQPNFIIRNKVDHVEFSDSMDRIIPEYPREVSLDDLKQQVEDQFSRDEISHREDIMESQMRKRNSELWQLRKAPLMKQNYSNNIGAAKNGN